MTARTPTGLAVRAGDRSPSAGFTLLELIVAAGILALIAVFSWRGLDTLIREREAIAASQETIDRLQRSFARIERDALLAADAQVDDGRALRLVSGPPSDPSAQAAVEYRLADGALTRSVPGTDGAPLVLLDGVASIRIEAWMPAPRGGAWVRNKAAASEPPRPPPNAARGGAGGTNDATNVAGANALPGTQLPQGGNQNFPGSTAAANAAGAAGNASSGPQQPAMPSVAAATGIRLAIARADGSVVTRAFVVGGG